MASGSDTIKSEVWKPHRPPLLKSISTQENMACRRAPTLRRMQSLNRQASKIGRGVGHFFGVSRDASSEQHDRWRQRRARLMSNRLVGCKLKDEYVPLSPEQGDIALDILSSPEPLSIIRDPLRRPGGYDTTDSQSNVFSAGTPSTSTYRSHWSRMHPSRRASRKEPVVKMAWDGLSYLLKARKKWRPKSRSFAPGSVSAASDSVFEEGTQTFVRAPSPIAESVIHEADESLLDDDVFFDIKSSSMPGGSLVDLSTIREENNTQSALYDEVDNIQLNESSRPMVAGWRRKPPPPAPGTPGQAHFMGHPLAGARRIVDTVVNKAILDKTVAGKRHIGEGIVGRLFKRSFRKERINSEVKHQLDEFSDHRPYFTYWVTFVQIVIFIVSVAVYGIAPVGIGVEEKQKEVLKTSLIPDKVAYFEQQNMWIGPRQKDLIHLGAKYSPCMRKDKNVWDLIHKDRDKEKITGCCINNDHSGCVQTSRDGCSELLSEWRSCSHTKYKDEKYCKFLSGSQRNYGTVCGLEPRDCLQPRYTALFEDQWPDDISKWPICKQTASSSDDHMNCSMIGRPCCVGIQGECIITTREHCSFIKGYFHEDAFLCSQVHCLDEICGMLDFLSPDSPDQVYRLWMSIFLHAGIFHLGITLVFQWFIMRDIEKLTGAVRMCIIYLGSGIAGNLASAIFLPYQVEAGPAGSQFGILGCLFVEVIQSWQMLKVPGTALKKLSLIMLVLFILGFLPWIDNYSHLTGFIFGILLSFALLPYVTFGKQDKQCKVIGVALSIVTVFGLLVSLFMVFYIVPILACDGCVYFNCIPFTAQFCESMGVKIDRIMKWT